MKMPPGADRRRKGWRGCPWLRIKARHGRQVLCEQGLIQDSAVSGVRQYLFGCVEEFVSFLLSVKLIERIGGKRRQIPAMHFNAVCIAAAA